MPNNRQFCTYLILCTLIWGHWGSPHGHRNRIYWIQIPDSDSMGSCVSSKWHGDYAHCTAGLGFTHCYAAQYGAGIWTEVIWRQSGFWIWIPDPHRIQIQGPVWRAPFTTANSYLPKTVNLTEMTIAPLPIKVHFRLFTSYPM